MVMLNRIREMMLDPQAGWDRMARDPLGAGVLLRNVLLPLALLAPAATMFGLLVFDTRWNPQYGYSLLHDRAPAIALATYLLQIVSVYLLAGVLYLLARTESRAPPFLAALQVAVFGSIPVLLSGATLVIPFNVVISMVAMMYSFYLYCMGVERLFGIRGSDSVMFIGVAMICMMILSGFIGGIASALGLL